MIMTIILICYKKKSRVKKKYDRLHCFCFSYIRDFDSDYICPWSDSATACSTDRLVLLHNHLYGGFHADALLYSSAHHLLL